VADAVYEAGDKINCSAPSRLCIQLSVSTAFAIFSIVSAGMRPQDGLSSGCNLPPDFDSVVVGHGFSQFGLLN
jgi:hypothetical protein